MNTIRYNKIASILLNKEDAISIKKLSLISNVPLDELKIIIKHFNSEGYLKNGEDLENILLNEKARNKN